MNKSNKRYKLNYLSSAFYENYNSNDYPEIENKQNRPYMVMLIQIENNTFAVPFRTNVKHNECILGKNVSYVFPRQNTVLTRKLRSNFPILHCNEVLENYFKK